MESKTLKNTDQDAAKKNVSDLVVFGGDLFKLLSKASSQKQGWMKSTKAMEIPGVGCVVQVTTQQLNDTCMFPMADPNTGGTQAFLPEDTIKHSVIAEAVTFVPGVKIETEYGESQEGAPKPVLGRKLVKF